MRRVDRPPLSEAAQDKLCELTWEVAAAGHAAEKHRSKARKKRADDLWLHRTRNDAFREIRQTLAEMAPGNGLCMYCELSSGNDIEHFWPKEKYPGRAFTWDNYLWSCSPCNSNFKGSRFPRDDKGAPLLVNPTAEDPREHLEFSPTTGKLVGMTSKGEKTVETLGFDRRGRLDSMRRNAWNKLQELLVRFAAHSARGDGARALLVQRVICQEPFAAALGALIRYAEDPRRRDQVHPECLEAIERFPEIRDWP